MKFETFIEKLRERLLKELPGIRAQQKMAPAIRLIKTFEEEEYPDAKKASVLILFYEHEKEIYFALMKRPDYDGTHGGQVSFPGGKIEETDTDAAYTALRETEEEVGIKKGDVHLVGKLSNIYIPPSNFFVYPFIGYVKRKPVFMIDENEVEKVLETPLTLLFDQNIKGVQEIQRGDVRFNAPYYLLHDFKVWGATAIILSELETILREIY